MASLAEEQEKSESEEHSSNETDDEFDWYKNDDPEERK